MTIYLVGDDAFIEIVPNYLLKIGTREEVQNADAEEIAQRVQQAIAIKEWDALQTLGQTQH